MCIRDSVSPEGPDSKPRRDKTMYVTVDDLWATRSTLHFRVTVHDDEGRWRHRYYPHIDINDVPEEALSMLLAKAKDTDTDSQYETLPGL